MLADGVPRWLLREWRWRGRSARGVARARAYLRLHMQPRGPFVVCACAQARHVAWGVLLVASGSSGRSHTFSRASRVRCSRPHPLRKLHAIRSETDSKPGQPQATALPRWLQPLCWPLCACASHSALRTRGTSHNSRPPPAGASRQLGHAPLCVTFHQHQRRHPQQHHHQHSWLHSATTTSVRWRRSARAGPPQTPHLAPRQTVWHHTKQDTTKNHCQTAQTARTAITATAPSPRWSSPKLE